MTNARAFTDRLAELLRREHDAMADFLVALADFDERRLWLELGHSSLFSFLHRELGLSKGAAFYRKTAAELVRRFPEVVEPLRDGRLCVTSVVELAKVLAPENRAEVLPRFFHRSKREAAEVVAELRPQEAPPRREVVTALRLAAPAAPTQAVEVNDVPPPRTLEATARLGAAVAVVPVSRSVQLAEHPDANSPAASSDSLSQPQERHVDGEPLRGAIPRHGRDDAEPLTADLSRLHVTVSRRFLAKLEAARAALSHSRPGATAEELLEAGLDLVLAAHAKRKGLVARPRAAPLSAAAPAAPSSAEPGTASSSARPHGSRPSAQPRTPPSTAKPRTAPQPAKRDRVPAHVWRAVWTRDGGRCQWPTPSGGMCGSTLRLELDHVVPRARGGPSTVENCRILCAVHNQYAARISFGSEWMERFTRRAPDADGSAPTQPHVSRR